MREKCDSLKKVDKWQNLYDMILPELFMKND